MRLHRLLGGRRLSWLHYAVAIGSFGDPNFPAPTIAVWEESRHPWVSLLPDTPPKRMAKQGVIIRPLSTVGVMTESRIAGLLARQPDGLAVVYTHTGPDDPK